MEIKKLYEFLDKRFYNNHIKTPTNKYLILYYNNLYGDEKVKLKIKGTKEYEYIVSNVTLEIDLENNKQFVNIITKNDNTLMYNKIDVNDLLYINYVDSKIWRCN